MQHARLDEAELAYDTVGSGAPVLLIHGSFIADAFFPLLSESRLINGYRVISYQRRGYGGSSGAAAPFTIGQQASDARALLRHLGISRAHVAGHSYGGAIAIQLSLDSPDLVSSLALLEPALIGSVPSGPAFMQTLATIYAMFESGDRAGATDAFLTSVMGTQYRPVLEEVLPPGAFEQAVADCGTPFRVELEALQRWSFTPEDALHIRAPVLSMVGDESEPVFREIHSLLKEWMPHIEQIEIPRANHGLQCMNASAVAGGLADFFDRHPTAAG